MSHIKQQAFTILELLIVIVVIAILAALSAPWRTLVFNLGQSSR